MQRAQPATRERLEREFKNLQMIAGVVGAGVPGPRDSASSALPAREDRPLLCAATSTVPNVALPITLKANLLSGWIAWFATQSCRPGGRFSPPAPPPLPPLLANAL